MDGSLRRNDGADAEFFYDRQSGSLSGASLVDQMAVYALQAGSVVTRPFGHRGYGWGCDVLSCAIAQRDIVVRLNADARFSIPFCDRYWSRILNSRYDYEEEIETFLRSVADIKYAFVDAAPISVTGRFSHRARRSGARQSWRSKLHLAMPLASH